MGVRNGYVVQFKNNEQDSEAKSVNIILRFDTPSNNKASNNITCGGDNN